MWQQKLARHADASPMALAASASDGDVRVEDGTFLMFRPAKVAERMGVVFYPGAYTDVRGYAQTLRPLAAAGYRVVAVKMPFELAILAPGRAAEVLAANPDVTRWAIMGHSVGGTSAAIFAAENPDAVDGVVIWDSFPPSFASLAAFPKPVWHIHRATPDGAPPESFAVQRPLFPPSSRWVPIPGGIHMYFGSFSGGGYQEDWAPSISQQQQHETVIAATLEALAAIEGGKKPPRPE
jgi:dienelactone hydrolase